MSRTTLHRLRANDVTHKGGALDKLLCRRRYHTTEIGDARDFVRAAASGSTVRIGNTGAELTYFAASLRQQSSDMVGELRTECGFKPVAVLRREGGDESVGQVATKCCLEPVESGLAIVRVAPVQLLHVEEQTGGGGRAGGNEGGGAHCASMGSNRVAGHPSP
jgi:hypothetical protein